MCPVHVASNRGGLVGENGLTDMFPVNMRVLAVDDDKTCLGILEKMLRKCQYQVTTESRAVEALRILRENRDKYDLVISDVKMPDINGLELLKVVGLEMDLPVIMLSDYSDTNLVMEGITHGACDYLSKPVRIEELKNIWQHVVRRRKFEPKDRNNGPSLCPNPSFGNDHQSENSDRKRKDLGEKDEEEEDGEEDGSENGDSSRQKKPRIVWSMELHQKFVVAVHQLGLDKAVPKKILDLMNHEGLTRENVASHLQKFRIYLKKLHQDKMAALEGKNAMRMASLDGFRRFSNASLPSYPGLRFRGVSPSENMNRSHGNNLHSSILPSYQNPSLFQGVSPSLDYKEFGSIDDPSNPPITLRFRDQSSPRTVHFGTTCSFNASWQGRNQLASFPSSSLPMSAPFGQSQALAPPNSFVDTFSLSTPRICSNKMEMPSASYLHSIVSPDDASMDQNGFVSKAETGQGMRPEMEFLLEQTKSEDGYAQSLDDIMNTFDKREQSTTTLLDGDYIWV